MTGAVTISSVTTATKTTSTPNFITAAGATTSGGSINTDGDVPRCKIPSGGTWRYCYAGGGMGTKAGGSYINCPSSAGVLIAIRIS